MSFFHLLVCCFCFYAIGKLFLLGVLFLDTCILIMSFYQLQIRHRKRTALVNLSQFTDNDTCGFNDNYISYVNKLCQFWHEGKNAVVIDNQVSLNRRYIIIGSSVFLTAVQYLILLLEVVSLNSFSIFIINLNGIINYIFLQRRQLLY